MLSVLTVFTEPGLAATFKGQFFLRLSRGHVVACGKVNKLWIGGVLGDNQKFTAYKSIIAILKRSLAKASPDEKRRINRTIRIDTRLMNQNNKICKNGPGSDYFLPPIAPTATPVTTQTPSVSTQVCKESTKGFRSLCPVLFRSSEQAAAGDFINIQGGGFESNDEAIIQPVNLDGTISDTTIQTLTISSRDNGLLQAKIPSDLSPGVWSLRIRNGTVYSNNLLINKPIIQMTDSASVRPSSPLRIYGKNFVHASSDLAHVRVYFKNDSGLFPATIMSGDQFSLRIITPDSIPVGAYSIIVNNGYGGSLGDGSFASIDVLAPADDVFHLGIGWGGDYAALSANVYNVKTDSRLTTKAVGNGITDDRIAIQEAVNKAGLAGGGVVFLPAGTYYVNASAASILIGYSKVVIVGAGKDLTKVTFGSIPNTTLTVFSLSEKTSLNGFADFTLENLNTGDIQNGFLRQYSKGTLEKVFIKGMRFTMRAGSALGFGDIHNFLIAQCEFYNSSTHNPALYVPGNQQIIIRDSIINFCSGRNALQKSNGLIVEDSQFNRDIACVNNNQIESGGIEISFTKNGVIKNNIVRITGDTTTLITNDSELILTQQGPYPYTFDGHVTDATATTLSDATKNWTDPNSFNNNATVKPSLFITGGLGIGQKRSIIGFTPTSITIDRPWDITPNATSYYAITSLAGDTLNIIDNQVSNGKVGISLYDGAYSSIIYGNTLYNTGGLGMRGQDRSATNLNEMNLGWNNVISNNTVITTHGIKPGGFYIALVHVGTATIRPGVLLANEARENSLVVSTSDTINGYGVFEAVKYYNVINEGGGFATDTSAQGVIGSIFSRNTTTGAPYVLMQSVGTVQTVASAE